MGLLSLFKKRRSASDLGELVFEFVRGISALDEQSIANIGTISENDRPIVARELVLLRCFAVDYAMAVVLGKTMVRDQVRDSFINCWKVHTGSDRMAGEVYSHIEARLSAYRSSLKSTDLYHTGVDVAKVFANSCSLEDKTRDVIVTGMKLAVIGKSEFDQAMIATRKFLRGFRIVN